MIWLAEHMVLWLALSFALGLAAAVAVAVRRVTTERWEEVPLEPEVVADEEDAEDAPEEGPAEETDTSTEDEVPQSPFPTLEGVDDPAPWQQEEHWSRPARLSAHARSTGPSDEWEEAASNWRTWASEAAGRSGADDDDAEPAARSEEPSTAPSAPHGEAVRDDRKLFARDREQQRYDGPPPAAVPFPSVAEPASAGPFPPVDETPAETLAARGLTDDELFARDRAVDPSAGTDEVEDEGVEPSDAPAPGAVSAFPVEEPAASEADEDEIFPSRQPETSADTDETPVAVVEADGDDEGPASPPADSEVPSPDPDLEAVEAVGASEAAKPDHQTTLGAAGDTEPERPDVATEPATPAEAAAPGAQQGTGEPEHGGLGALARPFRRKRRSELLRERRGESTPSPVQSTPPASARPPAPVAAAVPHEPALETPAPVEPPEPVASPWADATPAEDTVAVDDATRTPWEAAAEPHEDVSHDAATAAPHALAGESIEEAPPWAAGAPVGVEGAAASSRGLGAHARWVAETAEEAPPVRPRHAAGPVVEPVEPVHAESVGWPESAPDEPVADEVAVPDVEAAEDADVEPVVNEPVFEEPVVDEPGTDADPAPEQAPQDTTEVAPSAAPAAAPADWDTGWQDSGSSPFPTLADDAPAVAPSVVEDDTDRDLLAEVSAYAGAAAAVEAHTDPEVDPDAAVQVDREPGETEDDAQPGAGLRVSHGVPRPYGPGSAYAPADGNIPVGYAIKGQNATKLFYPRSARFYTRVEADVYFDTEQAAEQAGFTRFDRRSSTAHVSLRPENLH